MLEGRYEPRFRPLAEALEQILEQPPHGGAALALYQRGRLVCDVWGGVLNGEGERWKERTTAVSYSTTKGVLATAVHVLRSRGLLDYDAPVARYWPEFADAGKGELTVRTALTHGAGLYDARSVFGDMSVMLDEEASVRALERARPAHAPGRHHGYHALTWGPLIGEIVKRVARKSVSAFIREELAEPLGLRDFHVGAPVSALAEAARIVNATPVHRAKESSAQAAADKERRERSMQRVSRVLNLLGVPLSPARLDGAFKLKGFLAVDLSSAELLQKTLPAVNGLFSARDLARFYALMANGGSLDGVQLLSSETHREATRVHVQGLDYVLSVPMRWRLGYHAVFTPPTIVRGAFGHSGYNGSGAWASPRHQAALGYVVNAGTGTPFGDKRLMQLTRVALACLRSSP